MSKELQNIQDELGFPMLDQNSRGKQFESAKRPKHSAGNPTKVPSSMATGWNNMGVERGGLSSLLKRQPDSSELHQDLNFGSLKANN
jgi:hypothetical protein